MEYSSSSHVIMIPRVGAARQSTCERYGTRVQLGAYIADIVADNEENPRSITALCREWARRTSSIWGRKALLRQLLNLPTVALKSWLDRVRRKPR
jgi:hypothetical protein